MLSQAVDNNPLSPEAVAETARIEVLFIIDYFHRTGGTEKHLAELVAGLPASKFRCSIVVFDLGANPLLDSLRARGVPIIDLPVQREYVPNAILQGWRLAKLIHHGRFDIIQTMHQKADSYGALIARLAGRGRLVSSKRDIGELRKARHFFVNRRLRSLFDAYIVVADAVRTAVKANEQLPDERIVTIYNGVDTQRFRVPSAEEKVAARVRLGFAADDLVVGMVAGFRPEKNHAMLFAAALQALPQIPSLKVLAVGGGPLLARFREQIANSELAARTTFTGAVDDVVPYLWSMDIGCLTPGSNEGFSNAVLEQMAVGLPVVATDVGGNAEAILEGRTGRVIAASDAAALARALIDLHADAQVRTAFGAAARRRIEERFSLEQMCAAHAGLYCSLVARGS